MKLKEKINKREKAEKRRIKERYKSRSMLGKEKNAELWRRISANI